MDRSVKAVFFDLDDTLRDREAVLEECLRPAWERALARYPAFSLSALGESFRRFEGRVLTATGEVYSLGAFFGDVLRACGVEDEELAEEMARLYEAGRAASLQTVPGARPLLEKLAGRYILGVITNGQEAVQRAKLARLGLERYFRYVITAERAGCAKPSVGIFRLALEAVGCEAQEAAYVGDSLEVDVAGARAVGMVAIWFNREGASLPAGAVEPDHEIRALAELLAIL